MRASTLQSLWFRTVIADIFYFNIPDVEIALLPLYMAAVSNEFNQAGVILTRQRRVTEL
jgi:hypothetical protein